jgi:hypothetical protein
MVTSGIDSPCKLTPQDIIFGKAKQVRYDMLNHIIMYAKYFIHRQFVASKKLSINNFMNYYKQILYTEKERYVEKNQMNVFNNRFGNCTLLDE